jgi:hypothetical protein
MKKSYIFCLILNLSLVASTRITKLNAQVDTPPTQTSQAQQRQVLPSQVLKANDDLDKKIDIQDFGRFYPGVNHPVKQQAQKHSPVPGNITIPGNITSNIFSRPANNQGLVIKGAIRISNWVDDIPEFKVLFEGQESLTDENGFFSFPVDNSDLQKFKLIITRKIQHAVDKKNTFTNLKLIPDKKYLCYSFKKLGHNQGIWLQKEKNLKQKNFVIPKKSLIVLIDPKYVEKIEEWNVSLADNFIKLPRIALKSTIGQDKLKRISAKSLLCLEDSVFHERAGRVNAPDAKNSILKVTLP